MREAIGVWGYVAKPKENPASYQEFAKLYYHTGAQDNFIENLVYDLTGGVPSVERKWKNFKTICDLATSNKSQISTSIRPTPPNTNNIDDIEILFNVKRLLF